MRIVIRDFRSWQLIALLVTTLPNNPRLKAEGVPHAEREQRWGSGGV